MLMERGLNASQYQLHTFSFLGSDLGGLPFENMTNEVGKETGNKLGHFIEVDKRS